MELMQVFNSVAEWISNPVNQMVAGLLAPVALSTVAMLVMHHHDTHAAKPAKSSGRFVSPT